MEKSCVNCGNHTWGNDWWKCPPVCLKCEYIIKQSENVPSNWKPKAMTNADHLRLQISTEDGLAKFLMNAHDGDMFIPFCKDMYKQKECFDEIENLDDKKCMECMKAWLRKPYEGD